PVHRFHGELLRVELVADPFHHVPVMQSEPSQKEPERPEAHTGSSHEADDRKPHGNLLRAKTDLPAEGNLVWLEY
ncbi:MAG: hypothetical protein WBQ11_21495, partial [Isosphaeraceae bacterium]